MLLCFAGGPLGQDPVISARSLGQGVQQRCATWAQNGQAEHKFHSLTADPWAALIPAVTLGLEAASRTGQQETGRSRCPTGKVRTGATFSR